MEEGREGCWKAALGIRAHVIGERLGTEVDFLAGYGCRIAIQEGEIFVLRLAKRMNCCYSTSKPFPAVYCIGR